MKPAKHRWHITHRMPGITVKVIPLFSKSIEHIWHIVEHDICPQFNSKRGDIDFASVSEQFTWQQVRTGPTVEILTFHTDLGFSHFALSANCRGFFGSSNPLISGVLPRWGKMCSKLSASSTRHVFIIRKTCRDTCHTEMGGQVQPPTGVGSLNFPYWEVFLKLRKSRHSTAISQPSLQDEWLGWKFSRVSLWLSPIYCNKNSPFSTSKTNYFSPIPSCYV